MSQYVTVAFLSHALCEATINARLAIGLARSNREQLFSILERAKIQEKWVDGLKVLSPTYELPKGCALYETLKHLIRERNALVHYKITLEVFDGSWQNKLDGSRLNYTSLDKQIIWMKRFFSLPYDLNIHANCQLPDFIIPSLCNPTPIQLYTAHSLN